MKGFEQINVLQDGQRSLFGWIDVYTTFYLLAISGHA